ncbi:hypothetical protein PG985_001321 [Apiospora marii]|uniref:Uncharacterized protein n=1 Tax=Apiospora marii TaxID=335849 RepID=A0ABR1RHK9_9PEZI
MLLSTSIAAYEDKGPISGWLEWEVFANLLFLALDLGLFGSLGWQLFQLLRACDTMVFIEASS